MDPCLCRTVELDSTERQLALAGVLARSRRRAYRFVSLRLQCWGSPRCLSSDRRWSAGIGSGCALYQCRVEGCRHAPPRPRPRTCCPLAGMICCAPGLRLRTPDCTLTSDPSCSSLLWRREDMENDTRDHAHKHSLIHTRWMFVPSRAQDALCRSRLARCHGHREQGSASPSCAS